MPLPSLPTVTRASLRTALKARLNNSAFWADGELNLYIAEALQVWQASARYFRKQVSFNTHDAQAFYDLSAEVPDLAYTVKDSDLLLSMQYSLLEPPGGTPTAQFPAAAYAQALEARRNQFLLDSGSVIKHYDQIQAAAGVSRVTLGSALIDVRRVAWQFLNP